MAEAEDFYGGRRRMTKARGMMGYEDYSPMVLKDVKLLPCGQCRKKTPHRKFAGKYYCDMCGELYTQARKVKKPRKTASRKKTSKRGRK
jgi:ribosomal protein L37AE/L43A